MDFHGVEVGKQFKRMRELVPERIARSSSSIRSLQGRSDLRQEQGADRARHRPDHPVPWASRPNQEGGLAGSTDEEIAETTFVAMAMAAGAAWVTAGSRSACRSTRAERMDLSLTEPQEMLRSAARSFVEREAPRHTIVALQRAESSLQPELWQKASELGWLGILVPSRFGGSESSLTDAAVLYEELGRGPLPGPFFTSSVLGALTLIEAATDAQQAALLPRVASSEAVIAVAITEPNTSWGPQGARLPATADGR